MSVGMDKKTKEASKQTPFVNFNTSHQNSNNTTAGEKSKPQKIAF